MLPRRVFRTALSVTLACGLLSVTFAPAVTSAAPTSVAIAGDLQSELGCSGDWQPECADTHLAYDSFDDVWQGSFAIPAGAWEYKAALDDSWTENYGANATQSGANITLNLAANETVKFYYDDKSHWVTDNVNTRIVTAVGDFQSELGCTGDWDPGCLRSWLQDIDGDGTFAFSTSGLLAGNYYVKAAIQESWDENYGAGGEAGGSNISFSVPFDNALVNFMFVSSSNVLTVEVESLQVPEPGSLALLGIGLAGLGVARRRNAQ